MHLQKIGFAALFALTVLFYFWTATTSEWSGRPANQLPGYYNLLARSYLAGRLSLLIQPSPQLLALGDPYDPRQNEAYRLHDASLFRGKYYFYYGPSPALVFAAFRLLTGLDFPQPLAVALFCSVGLLFSFLLLRFLCRVYLPETPQWQLLAGIPALGFGNVAPFLLRRPLHYEVAISCGYALVFASLYCFATGALQERPRMGRVGAASMLLGLASGARFSLLAVSLVPIALSVVLYRKERGKGLSRILIVLFGPLACCVLLLGLYNYIRFGSWTEFGLSYILQGLFSVKESRFFSIARAPMGLYYYLLAPPQLTVTFPFVHLAPRLYLRPPPGYFLEPLAGLLFVIPLTCILLLAPPALMILWRKNRALFFIDCLFLSTAIVLLSTYCIFAGTMRYEVDFASWFLIAALLLWYWGLNALHKSSNALQEKTWIRLLASAVFVLLVCETVTLNAAISFTGYYDNLQRAHPETYVAIRQLFRPLEEQLQLFSVKTQNRTSREREIRLIDASVPNPQLIAPTAGTVLARSPVTFTWNPVAGAQDYWIDVGTAPASGNIASGFTGGVTSRMVDLHPYLNGSMIYVQLYSKVASVNPVPSTGNKFEYATNSPLSVSVPNPQLIAPTAGTVLARSPVTFTWNPVAGAQDYWIDVGTVPASGNIASGFTGGVASRAVDLRPYLNGSTIYVQLYSKLANVNPVPGTGNKFQYATRSSVFTQIRHRGSPQTGHK